MESRLKRIGVVTVGDLRALSQAVLQAKFGRYGLRLYELAQGVDHNRVLPNRLTKSISAEDTFERDIPLKATEGMIRGLAEKVWTALRKDMRVARTVVLKLKTSEFNIITRSHTPVIPPNSCEELTTVALSLQARVKVDSHTSFRLVGVGLTNFQDSDATKSSLFD